MGYAQLRISAAAELLALSILVEDDIESAALALAADCVAAPLSAAELERSVKPRALSLVEAQRLLEEQIAAAREEQPNRFGRPAACECGAPWDPERGAYRCAV